MAKTYTVRQCDESECPFRALSPNYISRCRLTKKELTSTIWPTPKSCPLREGLIKVVLQKDKRDLPKEQPNG